MTSSFPLQWPVGRKRTTFPGSSKFKQSAWDATQALLSELRRLGASNVVISTNVELRNDGLPYANRKPPQDKGVAVYFTRSNRGGIGYRQTALCFACDKYDSVGDNIYAIAKTIEALRGIERWGTGEMVEQAFAGFVALPPPAPPTEWWNVLDVTRDLDLSGVTRAYHAKAKSAHPDNGGTHAKMAALNDAYSAFKKERGIV